MARWGQRKTQVLLCREKIIRLFESGLTICQAHETLTESGKIDMPLRTFRRYAVELRNEVLNDLSGNDGNVIQHDFSRHRTRRARSKTKARAASSSGHFRTDHPPGPSSFDIPDAYSQEFGDKADKKG